MPKHQKNHRRTNPFENQYELASRYYEEDMYAEDFGISMINDPKKKVLPTHPRAVSGADSNTMPWRGLFGKRKWVTIDPSGQFKTLWDISQATGVTIEDIYEFNPGTENPEVHRHLDSGFVVFLEAPIPQNETKAKGWKAPKGASVYAKAIEKGQLAYAKHYGWVDMTHGFTPSPRFDVSAANLWKQILEEWGSTSKDGEGHEVTYRQDAHVFLGIRAGTYKSYYVQKGLSLEKKREVAVAIFQDISMDFEKQQNLAWWSSSSYSPEDLPSNMLGLYAAMFEGLDEKSIKGLIEVLTPEQSFEILQQYPETFTDEKYKNRSFEPIFFDNKYSPASPKVPLQLSTVKPATYGTYYRYWTQEDQVPLEIDTDYFSP